MHNTIKTVPNQKIIKVNKQPCNKQNLYTMINIKALQTAAQNLDAGAFKLWIYFAENQNSYEFALSNKAVEEDFGMKRTQYNNAINSLIKAGYIIQDKGNKYNFYEIAVDLKPDNTETEKAVDLKQDNSVIIKENNTVVLKDNKSLFDYNTRNITDNTNNITITDNTEVKTEVKESLQKKIDFARNVIKTCTDENNEFIF